MIFHRTARQTLDFIIRRRPHLLLTKSHLNPLNRPLSHFSNLMSSKPTDVNSTDLNEPKKVKSKIVSTMKKYIYKRRDYSKKFTDNNMITPMQAMNEYLLAPRHLEDIIKVQVRSPYVVGAAFHVLREKDVEKKAIEVHGSLESLKREKKRLKRQFDMTMRHKRIMKFFFGKLYSEDEEQTPVGTKRFSLVRSGAGRVVAYAALMNAMIFVSKFVCFCTSGSASMFSESFHSLADTINQLLLLWGINESLKKPDPKHPYGRRNMKHIMSLISGVGIFCVGSGVSVYHGIQTLYHGGSTSDIATSMSFAILGGSFILEFSSLLIAFKESRMNADKHNLPLLQYIREAGDPSTNVVLLEDSAAVLGVGVAGTALGLSYYTGNYIYDAVGSIMIGGILGVLATFLVTTNINFLVGRSIPTRRLDALQEQLEDDVVVRGVYDVKATMTSADEFKFKAEIDFDGMEITRAYLSQLDMEQVQREFQAVKSISELDELLLRHGEHVIDELGSQVDRLEGELKLQNPDLRHIDLEVL